MMMLFSLLVLTAISHSFASICSGKPASSNWYGNYGYPPYFNNTSPETCPQKYELSRCEQSAVMMDPKSEFPTKNGLKECTSNFDCFPTKVNCNDTPVCSDLINLKNELVDGGHNILCRHEKTQWQMHPGELKGCHLNGDCLSSNKKSSQRQLHPYGYEGAKAFTDAFRHMNITIGKEFSSPFSRCAQHAELFSDAPTEDRNELLYTGDWREVLSTYGITEIKRTHALKWQAHNIRNFAGKKPARGENNVLVTHGINIKLGFGLAVDEGYCLVLKPNDKEESLATSIGNISVANLKFEFDIDAYPVEVIARMSPESANQMQTCNDVQKSAKSTELPKSNILAYDQNNDMDISKEEFVKSHNAKSNSADAFDFIKSIQPAILGKKSSESIELGQFFHMNWGWREIENSAGGIAFPWRSIIENTIGSGGNTANARVLAFNHANAILSILARALSDSSDKYPSKKDMEDKLLNCEELHEAQVVALSACSAKKYLSDSGGDKYFPMGPGEGGTSIDQIMFGTTLAYPSVWEPDFYDSKILKVGRCLIVMEELTFAELMESMGCPSSGSGGALVTGGGGGDDLEGATTITNQSEVQCSNAAEIIAYVFAALFGVSLMALLYIAYQRKFGIQKVNHHPLPTQPGSNHNLHIFSSLSKDSRSVKATACLPTHHGQLESETSGNKQCTHPTTSSTNTSSTLTKGINDASIIDHLTNLCCARA